MKNTFPEMLIDRILWNLLLTNRGTGTERWEKVQVVFSAGDVQHVVHLFLRLPV